MLRRVNTLFTRLRTEQSGATAIEYALITAFIVVVLVAAMLSIGGSIGNMFMQVANGF